METERTRRVTRRLYLYDGVMVWVVRSWGACPREELCVCVCMIQVCSCVRACECIYARCVVSSLASAATAMVIVIVLMKGTVSLTGVCKRAIGWSSGPGAVGNGVACGGNSGETQYRYMS
ncbi:hypothetical protein C8Q79DRAFT_235348 [Trametes meyenii]|nr:hypothetical protein C8Q79DRAFT_235348 [Trametes meyenii]